MLRKLRKAWDHLNPAAVGRWVVNHNQRGEINLAGLMMMGIGMIFLAVGFIIFPINLNATDTILSWHSANYSAGPPQVGYQTSDFTGLTAVTGILPLVILLGFVAAGAITGFMGIKMMRGQASASLNPGSLMTLGIGLIFIAVALIIFPVVLDGVASAMTVAAASSGTYTGLTSILSVTPLIVLTAFMTGGIVTGFFGVKGVMRG